MSKYDDAATQVRNAAQQFKAFSDAADLLSSLGSLDNAATEAEARHAQAAADIVTANTELDALHAEMADVNARIDKAIADGNAKAEQIEADANAKADAIALAASQAELVSQVAAKNRLDAVNAQIASASAELDGWAPKIAVASANLDAINGMAVVAQGKLDAINAQIAAITKAATA